MDIAVDDFWCSCERNQAAQMEHGEVAQVDAEKGRLKTVWMTPTIQFTYSGHSTILNDSDQDIHIGSKC